MKTFATSKKRRRRRRRRRRKRRVLVCDFVFFVVCMDVWMDACNIKKRCESWCEEAAMERLEADLCVRCNDGEKQL
ncbi:hypothetical protein L6452_36345 [Arctium lappa]|uniref:Uncharacterized protein n=1 Tax=Arctium lappa TaxID=4217 RepID=A0ACB8Y9L6_ARCLA|nr:hypothetical protein L6452_36345 [Arctium lappa]